MSDTPSQAFGLLELIAISGELLAAVLRRLPMTKSYRYKVVANFKNKRLFRPFLGDGVKAYRLTAAVKNLLMRQAPELYGSGYIAQFISNYSVWKNTGSSPRGGSAPSFPAADIGECMKAVSKPRMDLYLM